jgi:hypothetical protein
MSTFERLRHLAVLSDESDFIRAERDAEIRLQRAKGRSVIELADVTGLTRQRVYKICEEDA